VAAALTGNREAYEYLGQSIESFPRDQEMFALLQGCGLTPVAQHSLFFGIASIYTARRSHY